MHSFIFKKKNTAHFFFKLSANLAQVIQGRNTKQMIKQ